MFLNQLMTNLKRETTRVPAQARGRAELLSTRYPIAINLLRAIAAFLLVMLPVVGLAGPNEVFAGENGSEEVEEQVCDPTADYFLGVEDYSKAIRLHEKILLGDPNNALAHYHLGFAHGMVGRSDGGLREYQRAIDLGLTNWDLFLNLGLVYLENGSVNRATRFLEIAVLRAPSKPGAHFNLALAYELQRNA